MKKTTLFAIAAAFAAAAYASPIRVADCERDADLDFWAAADNDVCVAIMEDVFAAAGVETERVPFGEDHLMDFSKVDVICSAFRTEHILKDFLFPLQPLGRMHFALYATPSRAMELMSTKITDWPRMRVGYSPVSQGQISNDDRVRYFEHANLSPTYVEFPTSAGAVQALHDGEIDALFLYTPFGKRPEGVVEVVPIGSRNVYFAVRRDNRELFEKLSKAYRDCYIDHIDKYDELREKFLGISKPQKRVRVAAYSRGDLFEVSPDGERSGALEIWLKSILGHTHWTLDYVYGDYDQSLADVQSGRLDLIGGIGFAAWRREQFRYPHTPMGMLRVYLWTRPNSKYKPGEPDTWHGMKVGLLASSVSAQRAKRQFDKVDDISWVEFSSDRAMLDAYEAGEVDACVDVEMPELEDEKALHLYASHPMYICTSLQRKDLFEELEAAMDEICDDFPKYLRMISEHHYGKRSEMAALSLDESSWLSRRQQNDTPIYIDFSPWPFPIEDEKGNAIGFVGRLVAEISRRTGLKVAVQPQTGIQTAEAKFLRGDTDLWIPYPVKTTATYGATSVFAVPVPQSVAKTLTAEDQYLEFELFARPNVPAELVSILNKVMTGIDHSQLQEMFMAAAAERQVVHRVFGLTADELRQRAIIAGVVFVTLLAAYGLVMMILLQKQAKRANDAAALAEEHAQAKTRFLSMMSHELRTPLNAVIGFAEFLSREDLSEQRRREYTEGVVLSSTALLELINDILDLSKLEAGAMNMRSGTCDISVLLRELPAIFGYRVRRHGVKLVMEAPKPGEVPIVALSQQGMRQILINLVGNSAKFTESGEIGVKMRWIAETRTFHFEVWDTGCGISDEKLAKLFDPFVQDIASRMKTSGGEIKGTGLGLPIVKRMVDNAEGTITVKSELGKGTTFFIDIPNLKIVEKPKGDATPYEPALTILPERVLVVDDMAMNRKILGIHLSNLGVKDIRYAENGVKALEVMDEWVPDIVLSDMWMPQMDGTQLAEAMRRDRRLAEIPIVAVTADVDVGSTYDLDLFAKVISKPVTGDKLKHLFGEI